MSSEVTLKNIDSLSMPSHDKTQKLTNNDVVNTIDAVLYKCFSISSANLLYTTNDNKLQC